MHQSIDKKKNITIIMANSNSSNDSISYQDCTTSTSFLTLRYDQ